MTEIQYSGPLDSGARGVEVRRVQEWLTYHQHATAIDGQFGPATKRSLMEFQGAKGLPVHGEVDQTTFAALVQPMVEALGPIGADGLTLNELLVKVAQQHWRQHPVEIGGDNRGPWVRLYMAGNEGREWPWCAGFATFVLRQACRVRRCGMPHPYAFGCDFLAGRAIANGRLLRVRTAADQARVQPGHLFLVRKTDHSWQHIGIVDTIEGETFLGIEGNTNDAGSPEGYEVCRRRRSLAGKDYLIV